jgi:pimeloyl-ACP methyl ester carboxylesterase
MQINGHFLHVESYGPPVGPNVVLLHHGLGAAQSWKGQISALAESGYRVIAYDRWGYGKSGPRPALEVPAFSDDLADLLSLVRSSSRTILIGHSDGGTIALYFAAWHPEHVAALVTVAAHIYVEPKMHPGIEGIRQTFEQDSRFRAGLRRLHGEKTEAVFRNWYEGWHKPENQSWDMRPLLRQITCPTLVVQGMDDEHATPQHARDIAAAIPGAELWLEPGVGHMLPQDKPQEFNHRTAAFLAKNTSTEAWSKAAL